MSGWRLWAALAAMLVAQTVSVWFLASQNGRSAERQRAAQLHLSAMLVQQKAQAQMLDRIYVQRSKSDVATKAALRALHRAPVSVDCIRTPAFIEYNRVRNAERK